MKEKSEKDDREEHCSKLNQSKIVSVFIIFFFIISLLINQNLFATGSNSAPADDRNAVEIFPVSIHVEGCASINSDAIYMPGGLVYISVEDLFNYLKIQCSASADGNVLSGFIENEQNLYKLDAITKLIQTGKKEYYQDRGLITQNGVVYLETSLFGDYFGIHLTFNLRNLSIIVKSDFELPIIRQMKLDKIRSNLNKTRGEILADTTISRNYHIFNIGNLDWFFQTTQIAGNRTNTRFNAALGSEFLFGEAKVAYNYYTATEFDSRQLYYLWRWVDNGISALKQVNIGKIGYQSISSVYSPVIGFSMSNTPTSIRKAEGHYTINEYTQPNWIVELYINNGLIDYTKSDASGLFTFKVPMVYGFTTLELRFYGPMGEERSEKRIINMPYTFTPPGQFEYLINGGFLEMDRKSAFTRSEFSYGLDRSVTIGGGLEYLSSIPNDKFIPFVNTSFLPFSKLIVKGEYAHGVRVKGLFNYYLWDNALLMVDYAKYKEGQKAILNSILQDIRINLTVPYRYDILSGYAKFGFQQMKYKNFSFSTADLSISGYYSYFNLTLNTSANWIENNYPYVYSTLSLSYLLGYGFNLRSMIQFDFSKPNFSTYRFEFEKKFSDLCYMSMAYEHNVNSNYSAADLTFRYNLPFARTYANGRITNHDYITSQGAQGSLSFDSKTAYLYASEYSMVNRGWITVIGFLDINANGKYDDGEPPVKNLKVKIDGGKMINNTSDSITRIIGLEPFLSYLLEVKEDGFDNIAWRIDYKRISVVVDPNQFKLIEIPVIPVGEINGSVRIVDRNALIGIWRIKVQIFDRSGNKVAETLTEQDGYFSYMGLKPGKYVVKVDANQMTKLSYESSPPVFNIEIKAMVDGDVINDLNFVLQKSK